MPRNIRPSTVTLNQRQNGKHDNPKYVPGIMLPPIAIPMPK